MNLYYNLLKALLNKDLFLKYGNYIPYDFIKENYPEISKLYRSLDNLHEAGNDQKSVGDLELALHTLYPNTSLTEYRPIFEALDKVEASTEQVSAYLKGIKERSLASKLATVSLGVAEGQKPFSDLAVLMSEFQTEDALTTLDEDEFLDDDLERIYEIQAKEPGLSWPLESLNNFLGPLRKGDFGFVFARPETGKTSFLATACKAMSRQASGPIIWFNNEQRGNKVIERVYSSVLGLTEYELHLNTKQHVQTYKEVTKGNLKYIWDTALTRQKVERICARFNPSLIIYDQIDHIKGFHKEERNDLDLKAIYRWARILSQQYAPTIAVCQAGASGEGKRWLDMGDVDSSKTGKQGEADWILGIGKVKDAGLESVRYLNLSKNKLLGRHEHWEVRFKSEIGQYEDF